MEQFQQLRQVTTINLCIDQFEKYMIQMKRDHSDLTDKFFLLCFLSGLKDHIKHAVKSHQPSTLRTAYFHAQQQELAYMSASRKMPANATVQRTTPAQTFRQNTPANRESKMLPQPDKAREQGKCWYCPEPWVYGHKCSNVRSIVHAIQIQGHEAEFPDQTTETFLDAETNLPGGLTETTCPPVTPTEDLATDTLMQISAEALHGIPGDTTLSVVVHFGTHQDIALVDSGSSKTFLDEEFIKKAKLNTQPTQAHKVMVAGGGELTSYYFPELLLFC
jgi:hypothetical protein